MFRPQRKWTVRFGLVAILAAGLVDCGHREPVAPIPPGYGTLEVSSDPPGATILVDGADHLAITPDDFTLTAGTHQVSVSLAGHTFSPSSSLVAVVAGTSVQYTFLEYAPRLEPDTSAHDFGLQALDVAGPAWCFTVTNHGRAASDSGVFVLSGADAGSFAIVSGGTHPAIAPGASQQVCVAFAPEVPGVKHASIVLGAASVSLSGTGYKIPCTLGASAASHDFGPQDVGGPEPSWCFDITNNGSSACGDTVRLTGADAGEFAILSGAVYNLAPGASSAVCVAFRPTVAGARQATVVAGTASVTVSGTGMGSCELHAPTTPDGTDFGMVCTNSERSKRLVVANSGNLACTVTAVGCEEFGVSPASLVVPRGGSSTFTIAFQGTDPGPLPDCPVTLSDGTNQWTTTFTGTAISPPTVDFTPSGGLVAHALTPVHFVPQVQDNGSAVTSYLWDFGDGRTSTSPLPANSYALGGTYDVTLTVTNGCGASSTVGHTICIDELAYIQIYGFDSSTVPSYTTNVPDWGSLVPIVLYRGLNTSYGALPSRVCLNVTTGELLDGTKDGPEGAGIRQAAYEALGTTGQTFATAHLPLDAAECSVQAKFDLGVILWPNNPAAFYMKLGTCAHEFMGFTSGDDRQCLTLTNTLHCGQQSGDGRIEWGLEAPQLRRWASVNGIRFTFNCWYVCPGSGPQTRPLRMVDAPPGGATP